MYAIMHARAADVLGNELLGIRAEQIAPMVFEPATNPCSQAFAWHRPSLIV